jgi:hypothetical protein
LMRIITPTDGHLPPPAAVLILTLTVHDHLDAKVQSSRGDAG